MNQDFFEHSRLKVLQAASRMEFDLPVEPPRQKGGVCLGNRHLLRWEG